MTVSTAEFKILLQNWERSFRHAQCEAIVWQHLSNCIEIIKKRRRQTVKIIIMINHSALGHSPNHINHNSELSLKILLRLTISDNNRFTSVNCFWKFIYVNVNVDWFVAADTEDWNICLTRISSPIGCLIFPYHASFINISTYVIVFSILFLVSETSFINNFSKHRVRYVVDG